MPTAMVLNLLVPVHPYNLDRTPFTPSGDCVVTYHWPNRPQAAFFECMASRAPGRELFQALFFSSKNLTIVSVAMRLEILLKMLLLSPSDYHPITHWW